ncbi:DUF4232 domain-containing protein [Actinacidiphila bryophytorum]|uniref:DUF4232 domain-containing protein n=1 Tax=Actinacidiphila bryophytorum TaxID=1436133 RepID=A0A9W4H345_9ACTN|nr:DUF4232 domain-containing protein [Actinacidiphila bryophytorum]MBM9437167.1 DUF4232 domain-containing protein [Actinacidiphila bryophytorum]MBN6542451.1 DUF4232 domain-containing protein [Actinacidiphila bryophytorum]CAG7646950.1 conserved exported hypothetical protein [Actinacidiphila bryophytorum]
MPISSHRPATAGPHRARHRGTLLAAAAAALLSVAAVGCGDGAASGSSAGASGAPSSPAAATSDGSGDSANGATGTAPAGTQPPAPATTGPAAAPPATTTKAAPPQAAGSSRCTVTGLKMTLGRGDPGAGNVYYPLDFTNTTSHACTLDGFPGVSLLRGDGSVIGRPADRTRVKPAAVRITPGQTVEADLHTLNQGVKGDSCWRKPTLIMVYPPGSTDSMTLATSNPVVCGDTFDVGPVH